MLGAQACNLCEGTFPKDMHRESRRRAGRGRDMQQITWECQRVPQQPVPATGPGAFFN